MKALQAAIAKDPTLCDKFLNDPSINPVTGREIKFGALTYNKLVKLCGEPNKSNINASFVTSKRWLPPKKFIINPTVTRTPRQLYTNISGIAFTGNPDADKQILLNLDYKTLNKVQTNKYIYNLLTDNNFWRTKLEQKFGLISNDPDLNYEFLGKYLDNGKRGQAPSNLGLPKESFGKTFEYNFETAIKDKYPEVVKLLLDSRIIDPTKPAYGQFSVKNPFEKISNNYYPLDLAIAIGDPDIIKILLADPRYNKHTIHGAFYYAIYYDNLTAFETLVSKFPMPYATISYVISHGNIPFIKILMYNYQITFKYILLQLGFLFIKLNPDLELINIILNSLIGRYDVDQEIVETMLELFRTEQYHELKQYIASLVE